MKQSPTKKVQRRALTNNEFAILLAIKEHWDAKGVPPTLSDVAAKTGISVPTVYRRVQEMSGDWLEPRSKFRFHQLKLRRRLPARRAK